MALDVRTNRIYDPSSPGRLPVLIDHVGRGRFPRAGEAGPVDARAGVSDELRKWFDHDAARFEEFARAT